MWEFITGHDIPPMPYKENGIGFGDICIVTKIKCLHYLFRVIIHTCAITLVTQVARLLPPGDDMHPLCCQWTWPCYSRCYGHQRKVAEAASRGTVDLWSSTACKWQNIYVLVLIIYIQFIILQNYFLAALQLCHVILFHSQFIQNILVQAK